MYFKLFSCGWLPLAETYSFNDEMEVRKHTRLYDKEELPCQNECDSSVTKMEKNSHLAVSSSELFHLVQTRVYSS